MTKNYKTGQLPLNFIALGVMLLAVGIWRMIVLDWMGILLFVIAIVLLFLRSGIIIDSDKRRIMNYDGLFFIRKGEWEDIGALVNLQIIKIIETQPMSVLSISRTGTHDVYKLYMVLPNKKIEIMSGKEVPVLKKAKKISSLLQTPINNTTT